MTAKLLLHGALLLGELRLRSNPPLERKVFLSKDRYLIITKNKVLKSINIAFREPNRQDRLVASLGLENFRWQFYDDSSHKMLLSMLKIHKGAHSEIIQRIIYSLL